MSDKNINFDFYNGIFDKKTFHYEGPLFSFTDAVPIRFDFKIKIVGIKQFITVGELKDYLSFDFEVFNIKPESTAQIYLHYEGVIDTAINWGLKNEVLSFLPFLGLEEYLVDINNIKILDKLKPITESSSQKRNVVREVVKDVISIFKKGEGEYLLPEDLTGEMEYDFHNMKSQFTVEVKITESENVDGFDIDGGYYEDDDTFELDIHYNPNYFPQLFYDLVGELNETFRHELQHLIQKERDEDRPTDELPAEQYYLQPHELDAQIQGFKRLSKLRKEPFENIVRQWYSKNRLLDDEQKERVIRTILNSVK